jgi:hypothetical protein
MGNEMTFYYEVLQLQPCLQLLGQPDGLSTPPAPAFAGFGVAEPDRRRSPFARPPAPFHADDVVEGKTFGA